MSNHKLFINELAENGQYDNCLNFDKLYRNGNKIDYVLLSGIQFIKIDDYYYQCIIRLCLFSNKESFRTVNIIDIDKKQISNLKGISIINQNLQKDLLGD